MRALLPIGIETDLYHTWRFEDYVAQGNYDWVAPEVTSNAFALPLLRSGGTRRMYLLDCSCFGAEVDTSAVLECGTSRGLMPATTEEVLAFGIAFPYVQRCRHDPLASFYTVGLDAQAVVGNDRPSVLSIASSGVGRCLTTRVHSDPKARLTWLTDRYKFLFSVKS
jgi:hypothetical protein